MRACAECGGTACVYGPNRAGSRTTTCCVCARKEGWTGFRDRACEQCRLVQVKTPRRRSSTGSSPSACNPIVERPVSLKPKSPGSFGAAVRERRRQRLQGLHDRKAQEVSFKRAYDLKRVS